MRRGVECETEQRQTSPNQLQPARDRQGQIRRRLPGSWELGQHQELGGWHAGGSSGELPPSSLLHGDKTIAWYQSPATILGVFRSWPGVNVMREGGSLIRLPGSNTDRIGGGDERHEPARPPTRPPPSASIPHLPASQPVQANARPFRPVQAPPSPSGRRDATNHSQGTPPRANHRRPGARSACRQSAGPSGGSAHRKGVSDMPFSE